MKHVVVIGGGISGLAAVDRLASIAGSEGVRITLLESDARVGGVIRTERRDGMLLESGPDVILAAKPAGMAMVERLGLSDRVRTTRPEAKGSFILDRGRLLPIPDGMSGVVPSKVMPFVSTRLLSWPAKVRVGSEFLLPPRAGDADESVESFVVRRLGREMYDRLIEPLLSGIFAGDGTQLSIKATFPQLAALEREHRGLVRGMLATRKKAASAPAAPGKPARPMGLVSLEDGLGEMIVALERRLSSNKNINIRKSAPVSGITRDSIGEFDVTLLTGELLHANAVLVATPGHVAGRLVCTLDGQLGRALGEIPYASTVTVNVAFRANEVPAQLRGTGYTVPRIQKRPVLACTFVTNKFAGRAPDGVVLLRAFLGGAGRGEFVRHSDDEILSVVRAELGEVLGITTAPHFVQINRFDRVMAQYNLGHLERVERIEQRLATVPGLALAGNALRGVGIPDCIASGQRAADVVLAALAARASSPLPVAS
ncbi:MAG TPA: protoporphyrinogen oxidase [Gemmatimonadaceae bacterium]|nr:protoporphyrinogen oxidase [Gemmatimonadaceae bacterium]